MRLEDGGGKWASNPTDVMWSYMTTCRNSLRETPFSLAFGMEVAVPSKVFMPNHKTSQTLTSLTEENDKTRSLNLNLLEEKRSEVNLRNTNYMQKLERYYNLKVRLC